MGTASLVLLAIGASPWATFATILGGPLRDLFTASEILVRAVPSSWWRSASPSPSVAASSTSAEGQMQVGILASTAVALGLRACRGRSSSALAFGRRRGRRAFGGWPAG